jgi:V8-like Glu-specific endopeptidase
MNMPATGIVEPTSIIVNEQIEREQIEQLLAEGMEGIGKLESGQDPGLLTPRELAGTEAIVLLFNRPALLISNGTFLNAPEPWLTLYEHRGQIERSIAAVGRIEVDGHPDLEWIGTGFLVADDIVMTNRHVVVEFAQRSDGAPWTISPGIEPSIDFLAEKTSITQSRYHITDVIAVHGTYDLALLRLGTADDPATVKPKPLVLSASADFTAGNLVYVIGYPAMDSRRNDPAEIQRIFQQIYDVKRLQPGAIMTRVAGRAEFLHDSSTLGGNSGSCVVLLNAHHVIGLHSGGRYLKGNRAVDLSVLRADPIFLGLLRQCSLTALRRLTIGGKRGAAVAPCFWLACHAVAGCFGLLLHLKGVGRGLEESVSLCFWPVPKVRRIGAHVAPPFPVRGGILCGKFRGFRSFRAPGRRPARSWPCWSTTFACGKPISATLLASARISP